MDAIGESDGGAALGVLPPKLKPLLAGAVARLVTGVVPKLKPDSVFGVFAPKLKPPGAGAEVELEELLPKLNPVVLGSVFEFVDVPKPKDETAGG